MKNFTMIAGAIGALSMAACAANPTPGPGSGGPGYYGNAGYDDGYRGPPRADRGYGNPRYDDRYGDGRYNDRYDRYDPYDARYHGQRYYDDRARRYYYIDARTGATIWVNGDLRDR